MTALPPTSDFVTAGESKATFRGALSGLRAFLAGLLGTDGAPATALAALGAPFSSHATKTGAYTVVATDQGKVLHCTGTWSMAFTDAATLGAGFSCTVVNEGSGTITLDPYLSQQIDGATTRTLGAGLSTTVSCDGSAFRCLGRGGVTSFNGSTGDISASQVASAATTGYGYTPASSSHYHASYLVGAASQIIAGLYYIRFTRVDGSYFDVATGASTGA